MVNGRLSGGRLAGRAVTRFTGFGFLAPAFLGLTPQALCFRLLHRLGKTSNQLWQSENERKGLLGVLESEQSRFR